MAGRGTRFCSRFMAVVCIQLPFLGDIPSAMGTVLEDIGRMIDKLYTLCLVVLAILALMFILYIISKFWGGGARG